MATVITKDEAYAQPIAFLDRAMRGEEIVIAQDGQEKVRVAPIKQSKATGERVLDSMRGQFTVPASFFDPMTDEELREWGY